MMGQHYNTMFYRIAQNFGRFGGSLPIHQSFIRQKVVRSQLNSERILSTAKVFSTKVLCYTVIVILNCVVPKWSSSYSRVHHLVFTLGQMVHHTGLSNTLLRK